MPGLKEKSYPSDKEIREFWEWCGVSLKHEWDNEYLGYRTNGSFCTRCKAVEDYSPNTEPCLLPVDLNNLFKYAVPKLGDNMGNINFYLLDDSHWEATLEYKDFPFTAVDEDPALALFWAIREVVREH